MVTGAKSGCKQCVLIIPVKRNLDDIEGMFRIVFASHVMHGMAFGGNRRHAESRGYHGYCACQEDG